MPKKKEDIKAVMKKRNIMTIEQTAQLEIVKFMHKYFNNMLPDACNNFFQHNHRNCDTGRSWSKAKVFPKICRIELIQQLFKYKGPVLQNKLSPALKEIKSFFNQSRQFFITSWTFNHLKFTFSKCNCLWCRFLQCFGFCVLFSVFRWNLWRLWQWSENSQPRTIN